MIAWIASAMTSACKTKARIAVLAAVTAFLPGLAQADDLKLTWTQFVEPTEKALAIDVPTGWVAKGGVLRINAFLAGPWFEVTSPDGSIEVFLNDPTLPGYRIADQNNAEGTMVGGGSPVLPKAMVLDYRPGAEFAKYYGPTALAKVGCADAEVTGTQAMPDIAKSDLDRVTSMTKGLKTKFAFTPPPHEAGLATFTCQSGGLTLSAGVVADTSKSDALPFWQAGVSGYLTTKGQEDWALAILKHMFFSRQFNPQWDQAMRDAAQEALNQQQSQADAEMAQLLATEQAEDAAIRAKGQADMQRLTSEHQAFMNQMDEQSAARNANFAAYEAQKGLNNWNFIAHDVRNGALYRDNETGKIFEIDN
jgi:hypothetical protein